METSTGGAPPCKRSRRRFTAWEPAALLWACASPVSTAGSESWPFLAVLSHLFSSWGTHFKSVNLDTLNMCRFSRISYTSVKMFKKKKKAKYYPQKREIHSFENLFMPGSIKVFPILGGWEGRKKIIMSCSIKVKQHNRPFIVQNYPFHYCLYPLLHEHL